MVDEFNAVNSVQALPIPTIEPQRSHFSLGDVWDATSDEHKLMHALYMSREFSILTRKNWIMFSGR